MNAYQVTYHPPVKNMKKKTTNKTVGRLSSKEGQAQTYPKGGPLFSGYVGIPSSYWFVMIESDKIVGSAPRTGKRKRTK